MGELTRTLKLTAPPMRGLDVEAWAAGAHRYLKDGQLGAFRDQKQLVRQTFGTGKRALCKKAQKQAGIPQTGVVGPGLMAAMNAADAFDSLSEFQFETYANLHAPPAMCYPHPAGTVSVICQGLHNTAGLNGNWGMDFCAPGGTDVLAVEKAEIIRISGRNPVIPPDNLVGIWGWSITYLTPADYLYFSTHYGELSCRVGDQVRAGEKIGEVGNWPGNPPRSHTHLGVTSPKGSRDARRRITDVSKAPRVAVPI